MAQYYTIDEASRVLGLSVDEFRKKLATEWRAAPRRYPDGATLRFQAREIDELARTLGRHSDPDLKLGDAPLSLADEHEVAFVPLTPDKGPPSSGVKKKKSGSDSDVKLEQTGPAVRPVKNDSMTEEEIDLDAELSKRKSGGKSNPKVFQVKSEPEISIRPSSKAPEGSSEFELTLDTDSDEFELKLTDDDSDEVELGTPTIARKGSKSSDSGINLQQPADSGISLEQGENVNLALAPEGVKGPKTDKSGKKKADSDSEFELTLDDSGTSSVVEPPAGDQKDIFETDFELPALDDEPAGQAAEMESSDFDLAIDEDDVAAEEESASEVVALDEEKPRGKRRPAADLDEDDEELDDLEAEEDEDLDMEDRPRQLVEAAPATWGNLPAFVMLPCVLVMFFVGIMSLELVHSMWGYHQTVKPTGTIVRGLVEMFGGDFKE